MANEVPKNERTLQEIRENFIILNKQMIKAGFTINSLCKTYKKNNYLTLNITFISCCVIAAVAILLSVFTDISVFNVIIAHTLGTRCILPNNYFMWEATRPISDCQFCLNVSRPIILPNLTREEFSTYAYTSKPIIIKNAVKHWQAVKKFDFNFLKNLYDETEGAYESVEEDCQFLHFHSDFTTLRDVFAMSEARAKYLEGETAWYVGW